MYGTNSHQPTSQSTSTLPWSHRLSRTLRPASSTTLFNRYTSTLPLSSHPTGEIWKHIFSICVYSDLAGTTPTTWRTNRRFVRIEHFGLSGVVLYEIPVTRRKDRDIHPAFTLDEVFGSEESDYEDGMSITRLLNSTSAKVVYFPVYACTSFTIGQVMHSYLTNTPQTRPYPAYDGFFVFLDNPDNPNESGKTTTDEAAIFSRSPACKRSSSDPESDQEIEVLDHKSDSSVDSLGPYTPPRLDSPPIQELAASKALEKDSPCKDVINVYQDV